MSRVILVMFVALVVLAASPVFACYGDAGGGPAFSIVQQPILAQQYVQADVGCAPQQAIVAQQVYTQPLILRDSVGYGYGGRSLNVVVGGRRHGSENIRIRRRF